MHVRATTIRQTMTHPVVLFELKADVGIACGHEVHILQVGALVEVNGEKSHGG